jgi:phosphinothricin acetyltransferase
MGAELSTLIRSATRADVPGILDIYNEAVLHTTASYDYEPSTLEQRLEWFDAHTAHNYPVFVALDEQGKLLGWSSLSEFRTRVGYRFTAENSIYVAAEQRGRGVGKLLMPPLIDAARQLKLRAVMAVIDADNAVSLHMHETFGFERVGVLKQVGYKFERWLDVVYMELLIQG